MVSRQYPGHAFFLVFGCKLSASWREKKHGYNGHSVRSPGFFEKTDFNKGAMNTDSVRRTERALNWGF